MNRRLHPARVRVSCLAVAAMFLGACGGAKSGRSDYVKDGDSGAASPAATYTPNPAQAPDSTLGVGGRTGAPGAAGDTLGSRGKATNSTADAPRAAVPGRGGRVKP